MSRNPHALLVGMENSAATLENSVEGPQNLKCRMTTGFNNSAPKYIAKIMENKYF